MKLYSCWRRQCESVRRSTASWIVALASAFTVSACGGGSDPVETSTEGIECEVHGYACTWGDVLPSVIARSLELGHKYDAQLRTGLRMAEVAKALQHEAPGVVIQHDDKTLRFRLPGGRPVWIVSASSLMTAAVDGTTPAPTTAAESARGTTRPHEPRQATLGVVNPGSPVKSAVVLAPYRWQGIGTGADAVLDLLRDTEGYEVTARINETRGGRHATALDFAEFDNYDVIYAVTHGTEICNDAVTGAPLVPCKAGLSAETLNLAEDQLPKYLLKWVELLIHDDKAVIWLVDDFFRATYPSGLSKKLVYFDACLLGASHNSGIRRALQGPTASSWAGAVS